MIEIGRHGLLVERGWSSGLLLPRLPWSGAGTRKPSCRRPVTKPACRSTPGRSAATIWRFEAEVFSEGLIRPRSAFRFLTSSGSATIGPVALPSDFGVSSSIGRPANRRSLTMRAECLEADAALADVRVAIDAAAERALRIVHVEHLQPIEADHAPEFRERARIAVGGRDVVPRREQMAGVEADADPALHFHQPDDRRELLERRAERRALARRVLQNHHRPAAPALAQERVERFGDQREPVGLAAVRIAARMQDDAEQPQRFGAIDLVAHCGDRLRAKSAIGGRQVDQITGVRNNRA